MASLVCNNCHSAIHYHGEPNGIEYVKINRTEWEKIQATCFDAHNKQVDEATGYPKLFRSDTIEEDFPQTIQKFWKCPECGALLFFDNSGRVTEVYIPNMQDTTFMLDNLNHDIVFSDYEWDELTENATPNNQLSSIVKHYSKIYRYNNNSLVYEDETGKMLKYTIME